ncbi:MAG: tetratricopeptide repeat protein, partial [Planctomycetota bacterium]
QLRLFPNELSGYNGLAELAFERGRQEKALRLWAQSLRLYGDQPEVVRRVKQVAEKSDELGGKAEWVISEYAHRRARRPGPGQDPWEPPGGGRIHITAGCRRCWVTA